MNENDLKIITEELAEILNRINDDYISLIELCKKENREIISEDLNGLVETIMNKEKYLNEIKEKKEKLKDVIDKLKSFFGFSKKEFVPFNRIISYLSDIDKEKISKLKENMEENLAKIKNLSIINKKLITETVSFINYIIDYLKNGDTQIDTYNNNLKKETKKNELNFLDVIL